MSKRKPTSQTERARNEDGTFIGDDPNTPDVNEAYAQPDDAVEAVDTVEAVETVEAAEIEAPAGVVTIDAPAPQISADEAVFVVVSHIKYNGKLYAPGEDVSGLTAQDVGRMLKSQSIKPKE